MPSSQGAPGIASELWSTFRHTCSLQPIAWLLIAEMRGRHAELFTAESHKAAVLCRFC